MQNLFSKTNLFNKDTIYLDYASTTPVRQEVIKAMMPCFDKTFANPSSNHLLGNQAKELVEASRLKIAKTLKCSLTEIIFTGSGTESINQAIIGIAQANSARGKHIITSAIEHQAVLQSCQSLESQGFSITYLPVDKTGLVNLESLKQAITSETILVSIMMANNEIGSIQPVEEIISIVKSKNNQILIHTDACQCAGQISLDLEKLKVDLLSLNAGKIYGPKGVGLLFVRQGIAIRPIIFGGGQENNLRAGTENTAGIVGLAIALELAQNECLAETKRLTELRNYLEKELLQIEGVVGNSLSKNRLANNCNLQIHNVVGKNLISKLSEAGVCASAGSACTAGKVQVSHVLIALGQRPELASSGLRLTIGKYTTLSEIKKAIRLIKKVILEVREIPA